MSNLYQAHREWRTRPRDERFNTLAEMFNVATYRTQLSVVSSVELPNLAVEATDTGIVLRGDNFAASPTHWSFGQLGKLLGLPVEWLRNAPPTLVADSVRWGLMNAERKKMQLLWYIPENAGEAGLIRAVTTPTYKHLWDKDVIMLIRDITQDEEAWHRPPAATDGSYPSGYYMGDQSMFLFLVNEEQRISDGSPEGLARGFFVWNTEVQGGNLQSFGMRGFLYQKVCGNHIVWGSKDIFDLRMIHTGTEIYGRVRSAVTTELARYQDNSAREDEQRILAAQHKVVGRVGNVGSSEQWLTQRGLTLTLAKDVVHMVRSHDQPLSVWAVVVALTTLSQQQVFADDRNKMDLLATKLLSEVDA